MKKLFVILVCALGGGLFFSVQGEELNSIELGVDLRCGEISERIFFVNQPIHISLIVTNQSAIKDEREKRAQYKEKYIQSIIDGKELTELFRYRIPNELIYRLPSDWYEKTSFNLVHKELGVEVPASEFVTFINASTHKRHRPQNLTRSASLRFYIPPERTAQIESGSYILKVSYESEEKTLESEVEIEVNNAKSESDISTVNYGRANYYLNNNKLDKAIESAKLVIDRNPSHKNYYSYLILGQAHSKLGNIAESLSAYEEFLKFNPNESHVSEGIRQKVDRMKAIWK